MIKEYDYLQEKIYEVTVLIGTAEVRYFVKGETSSHAQHRFMKMTQRQNLEFTYKSVKEITIL
ncbi:hypothetical protein Zip_16 [Enterococcus phage vB_EfaP_Zip]|uniref:Uncharacterized protein n=1 Tax=Enterococcus phage vB_EfaP_Zip TaxID=2501743 RepID=A0A411B6U3_9CAUD|nr:hypothetical protein H3T63_gp16 [Enterococcus phage vB_EfaP_Zip]QAX97334.1 hypothetical protein Zip_16 [Enterococcus phage vB_EfaP_Zip]